MKLSEAIRLGAMMGPQAFGEFMAGERTCALGAAAKALSLQGFPMLQLAFSFIGQQEEDCPACHVEYFVGGAIVCLNDTHEWSRERIADWIATIEPEEVHASETIREVQLGQGPRRPTPEVETLETIREVELFEIGVSHD